MKLTILMICVMCAVFAGCSGNGTDASKKLIVSIEPQRFMLERIAGPYWQVESLLANGEDPESFDPAMSSLKSLSDSRAYFKMGGIEFEDNLIERFGDRINVIDCGSGINRIEGTHGHATHHDNHNCSGEHEHEYDPHTWTSLRTSKVIARNMLDGMIRIAPEDSAVFRKNYDALISYLDSCDLVVADKLLPAKGSSFMVWHPSLSYFARDYGLNQISIGLDNKEMSVASFKHNVDMAKEKGAVIFLVQPNFDAGKSEDIAKEAGAASGRINTLTYDMGAELMRIADLISNAKQNDDNK